jgi:hypothetical protein
MALDLALARCLESGAGVLRIYRWSRPTLSFGRNQRIRGIYDPIAAEGLGAEVIRRPTGGREVLHDRELTYSVALPLGSLGGLRDTYRTLNLALVEGLRSLGIAAELAGPTTPTPDLEAGPCFGASAPGEVTATGRKLVGSAQIRLGGVVLQHGSLLLAPPSIRPDALRASPRHVGQGPLGTDSSDGSGGPGISTHLPRSSRAIPGRRTAASVPPITLVELVPGPISFSAVAGAVEAAMAGALGGRWERSETTKREREVAGTLLAHYESPSWTWRR